jgi:hypothetical protein
MPARCLFHAAGKCPRAFLGFRAIPRVIVYRYQQHNRRQGTWVCPHFFFSSILSPARRFRGVRVRFFVHCIGSPFTASIRNGLGLYTLAKGVSSVSMVGADTPRGADYTLQPFVACSALFTVWFDACLHILYLLTTLLNTRHPSSTWLPGPYCSDLQHPTISSLFFDRITHLSCISTFGLASGDSVLLPSSRPQSSATTPIAPSSGIGNHVYLQCASAATTQQYCSSQSWEKHSSTGGHYGRSSCLYVHVPDGCTSTLLTHAGLGLRHRCRNLSRRSKTSTHTLATTQILSCGREGAQRTSPTS